jgi:microcystin-dependent protein
VLTFYANNNRIAITSKESFTPKQTISGFPTINQGMTLSTVDASSGTAPTKFWGTSSAADALNINGSPISASSFIRNDIPSKTLFAFNIQNSGGLTIGDNSNFNLSTDTSATVLFNKTSGASIDFKLTNNGLSSTVVYIDARARIGVGEGNTNPQATLDVLGDVLTSGNIAVTSNTNSTSVGIGSLATDGGLSVKLDSNFGGNITTYGNIYINNLDSNDTPYAGSVILPGSDSATALYDIGSSTRTFRNIYAQSFVGAFSGAFTGSLSGNITGSATKLASPTAFSLTGDVSSNTVSFNGQTSNGTAIFTTTISQDIITNKPEAIDSVGSDTFLMYRNGVGLKKVSKSMFISNIATMPIGAIIPYAGQSAPSGYLLCDGGEVPIGSYSELFQVIAYLYKPASLLVGKNTFALPDMRGRFPLGRDNMDNGTTVNDKTDPSIVIDAGGGPANRVTDVTADTIGSGSGADTRTLEVSNLPEHRHTLSSGQADYFAIGRPGLTSDTNGISPPGPQSTSAGLAVPNTGGVLNSITGQPVTVMNPYQTINYIIYTGVTQ